MRAVRRVITSEAAVLAALAILMARGAAAQATRYETIYSFQGSPDGADPKGAVVIGKDGGLYGTTFGGGTSVLGTVYRLAYAAGEGWKETVLYNFIGSLGQYPESTLVFGSTGALYGTTISGGGGAGAIFELAPPSAAGNDWKETVVYTFVYSIDTHNQNVVPNGGLLMGPSGTLYVTNQGSPADGIGAYLGTVDALAPPAATGGDWTDYELYVFGNGGVLGGTSGAQPLAGVVSAGGSLFGTTYSGGDIYCGYYGCGVVYELTPPAAHGDPWTETTIYTFTGSPDGGSPEAALTVGPGGVIYGTTSSGGSAACGCGTVFQLTPPPVSGGTWTESAIYSFTGINGDGASPSASVVVGSNGALYGTTQSGGSADLGTVFKLTPPATTGGGWTERVLHSFSGENGDGATPLAALVPGANGVLYGTTSTGGTAGHGTVFAVAP